MRNNTKGDIAFLGLFCETLVEFQELSTKFTKMMTKIL